MTSRIRRQLALVVAVTGPVLFLACGSDGVAITSSTSLPDASSQDGGGADTSSDSSSTPVDAAIEAEAAPPNSACSDLASAYGKELEKSRACNVNAFTNECIAPRERILGCGCDTYVNSNHVTSLDAIAVEWATKKCVAAACPASACPLATGGSCQTGGTCVDVLGSN